MCNCNKDKKNSAVKIIVIAAIAIGALAGMAVTFVYFMKKFKLKLAMTSPCDDCLAEDCTDCDYAADFDETPIENVDVAMTDESCAEGKCDKNNEDSDQ